jgi:hypothetical protein
MPLQLTPLEENLLSPVLARAVGPGVQGPAKMMAARGLMPLGPRDLVTALYQLALDPDAKVAEAAKGTSATLPENILGAALGEALDPRVLHFFAVQVVDRRALIERVLLNRSTHDDTLIHLAGCLPEAEVELLASNQERLLRCPPIIEALYFNKQARMSTVERLLELAVRNNISLNQIPEFRDIAAAILGAAAKPAAAQQQAAIEDEAFRAALADEGPVGDMEIEAPLEEDDERVVSISKLSLVKKIRLAHVGSAGMRALLVRDTNKQVAMAAIRSPAVTDQEAARYAADRALGEEIIRFIANKKEWMRAYNLKVNLVNNPKCPLSSAMHLLPHLREVDLRALTRSKNVPSTITKAAKEAIRKKSSG